MEIKPSQELVYEIAKHKKVESEPANNTPAKKSKSNELAKDSIGPIEDADVTHKSVDVSSIYPDPDNFKPTSAESSKNEKQVDVDSSSKPISLQIPSLFILACLGVILQLASGYSSVKVYTKYHQYIHLTMAVLLPLLIKVVGILLSFYLLFGRIRENVVTILNIYLVLLVVVLILTLLSNGLWLWFIIVLEVLYIAFIVHVRRKVKEAELN